MTREPSVPFVFPDENAAEVEAARCEGQRAGFRLGVTMLTSPRTPRGKLAAAAALQSITDPTKSITTLAREHGISRKAIHARRAKLHAAFPFLRG